LFPAAVFSIVSNGSIARTVKDFPTAPLLSSDPNHHGKPLTEAATVQALQVIGT